MAKYTINYDLKAPGRNYNSLYDAIKALSSKHWHALDSLWIVETTMTAVEIRDVLKKHLDSNDVLLVMRAHPEWASVNLGKPGTDWLKELTYA